MLDSFTEAAVALANAFEFLPALHFLEDLVQEKLLDRT